MAAIVPQPSREYTAAVAAIGGGAGFGQGATVGQDQAFQPAAVLPALRGTGTAAPVLQSLNNPSAPHKKLTGRFRRPG